MSKFASYFTNYFKYSIPSCAGFGLGMGVANHRDNPDEIYIESVCGLIIGGLVPLIVPAIIVVGTSQKAWKGAKSLTK